MKSEAPTLGRRFAALWTATGLANLADGLYQFTLPVFAVGLTDSAGLVAGVTVMLTLAWPVFGLHAGAIVDHFDRRRLMVHVNLIRAGVLGGLTLAIATDAVSIPLIYAAALVLGVCETLVDTGLAAIVPAVVPRPQLVRANSRIEVAQHVTNAFMGPPLAGALAAVAVVLATGIGGLLYAGAVVALLLIHGTVRPPREAPDVRGALRNATAGIRFLWRLPLLRTLTLLTAAMNVFWAAWTAVIVLYALEPGPLGLTKPQYGLLLTGLAVGAVAGSMLAEPLRRRVSLRLLLGVDLVGTMLLVGLPAVTANVWVVTCGVLIAGAGSGIWRVIVTSIRQVLVPDGLLGRVYSANRFLSWGVLPVGAALGGVVAEAFGVRSVFIAGGVLSAGLLVVYALTVEEPPLITDP